MYCSAEQHHYMRLAAHSTPAIPFQGARTPSDGNANRPPEGCCPSYCDAFVSRFPAVKFPNPHTKSPGQDGWDDTANRAAVRHPTARAYAGTPYRLPLHHYAIDCTWMQASCNSAGPSRARWVRAVHGRDPVVQRRFHPAEDSMAKYRTIHQSPAPRDLKAVPSNLSQAEVEGRSRRKLVQSCSRAGFRSHPTLQ
jgi:hypothetical protein